MAYPLALWLWQCVSFTLVDRDPIICHHQQLSLIPVRRQKPRGAVSSSSRLKTRVWVQQ